ncbi:SPT20 [Candida jiufengensis]|uniref:SPT20 n=1 Tax=Candida jiufengensis TaxID=497108 RepID=UPI0022246580|nr:SPT20 [Candida jiufengensis]KAI5953451.1 SPT20 [Candida jiufengensis]
MIKSEVASGSTSTPPIPTNKLTPVQIQQAKQQLLRQQQLQQQQQQHQAQQQAQQQQLKQKFNLKNYHFASSTEEILRKYSKYPASLSLHIFENYYRFNNSQDSQIIPKNSPMIKNFMNHVLKEEIPVEMSELLKDFAIKSYDGCLILQVYDHRNMIKTFAYVNRNLPSPQKDPKNEPTVVMKPRTYRTLLRPTPLSIYYDLLYHTDSALTKFTDTLSLQMESEILTLTNRELDLSVKLNPYDYSHLRPEIETEKIVKDENEPEDGVDKIIYSHRESVEVPPRKIHQDELVLHKSSEYEELMILLSNKNKRFDDNQDKKLVIVNPTTMPSTSTAQSVPVSKPSSKENSVGADGKTKKNDKTTTQNIPAPVTMASNPVRATGQFMRLRLIEEIRKKRELEKSQQEAKIQAQANSVQNDMMQSVPEIPPPKVNGVSDAPTPAPTNKRQYSNSSQTPATKRAKKDTKKSIPNPSQSPQAPSQQTPHIPPESQIPIKNGVMSSTSTSQIPSSKNTPMIPNPGVPIPAQQQQQRMSQTSTPQQLPMGTPSIGQAPIPHQQQPLPQQQQQQPMSQAPMTNQNQQVPPQQQQRPQTQPQQQPQLTLQQQQHQQIFQNSLSIEEQQLYKQIQSKMQALAMMGQTGVAPNGQQLSAQHKQQALQQVKVLQQQLLSKFPIYFQRLKQFQIFQQKQKQLQQQKLQQQQQQQQQQSGGMNGQAQSSMMHNNMSNGSMNIPPQQFPNQLNNSVPPVAQAPPQQQQVEPKKKRAYKKKTAQT